MKNNQQLQENTILTTEIPSKKQDNSNPDLNSITLRELRGRGKQMDGAIQAVQSRLNYMKLKQQKTIKKVINVKKKITSLQNVRNKVRQQKQTIYYENIKMREDLQKKTQYTKLIKDHLKFNKKIVITLMNHKVNQDTKSIKDKHHQLKVINNIKRENMIQQNTQRANRVRFHHIDAHQKRKLYFLDKLREFKSFKEQKLRQQIHQRQRHQNIMDNLEEKERVLLQRLSNSERFRMKCQQEYQQAKYKYHSFYESNRGRSQGVSRQSSFHEGKAQIFIL